MPKGKSMNYLELNFLGKDSVPDNRTIEIDPVFAKNLQALLKDKDANEKIFDEVSYLDINRYFHSLAKDCTPKTLRTCKMNQVLVEELKKKTISPEDTLITKIRALTEANLAVSTQANHQKNIGKNYKEQEGKAKEKLAASKARVKELKVKSKDRLLKLKEELAAAKHLWTGAKLKEKVEAIKIKKEKILAMVMRAEAALEKAEFNLDKKKATKQINLGTALNSYCDQRVLFSWCEEYNVPIEKIYTKSQLKSCDWARGTGKDFWRKYPNV